MIELEKLKTGLTIISAKGDIRQPQSSAMERVPEGYSRWQTASLYLMDIERIMRELRAASSFVATLPDATFLSSHSINEEDYVMYHQGYFFDLVHQLKDKLCQLIKAIITPEKNYSQKHEKAAELKKLLKDDYVQNVPNLQEALKEWDDGSSNGVIAIVLKKRTFYHHFKNPLPGTESYLRTRTHRFLLSPSFQANLSDYGRQMITERGEQNLRSWQSDTADKMEKTIGAIEQNVESIATSLLGYYKFPDNQGSGKRTLLRYMHLNSQIEVSDSNYSIQSIPSPTRGMLEALAQSLPFSLGDEFVAFYVTGSIPRGDFMRGLSDINLIVIIKRNIPELKQFAQHFIDGPYVGAPMDTHILSQDEFMSTEQEKLRFICRTDGLLLAGTNLLTKEKTQKICFRLAWMLNKDYKVYLSNLKEVLKDASQALTPHQLTLMARELGKRTFRLGFSQVIGNNLRYSPYFKEMRELNNFYYPSNRQFNDRTYQFFTAHPVVTREALASVRDNIEEKMMPLYDAVNKVVNENT